MDTRRTSFPLIPGIPLVCDQPLPRRAAGAGPAAAPARAEDCALPDAAPAAWAEQLDALARCLARMDALMAMVEADLDRHTRVLAALADPREQRAPVAMPPDLDFPPYPDLPGGAGAPGRGGRR
ncbi:hypothetical protein ND748_24090 [Frankia sp. AiPs1]|uniref:hypothetical protein n=1 Tax=Frankia sp. AiPs1 TaxID=573493 RepID=UPI00204318C2|nr:hypothetical protein [Frankia sp. AiPs1]MCM3924730.1 hypothetical protein [Frankia sp. AiPs1]